MTQISPNPNPQDNNNHNGSVDQAVSLVDNQSPDPSESETSETPVLSIENQVYPSPEPPREPSPTISPPWHHWPVIQWWQRLTLRSKSILAATVIGVMPVVMV